MTIQHSLNSYWHWIVFIERHPIPAPLPRACQLLLLSKALHKQTWKSTSLLHVQRERQTVREAKRLTSEWTLRQRRKPHLRLSRPQKQHTFGSAFSFNPCPYGLQLALASANRDLSRQCSLRAQISNLKLHWQWLAQDSASCRECEISADLHIWCVLYQKILLELLPCNFTPADSNATTTLFPPLSFESNSIEQFSFVVYAITTEAAHGDVLTIAT